MDRGSTRCAHHGAQSPGRDGPLLRRHARYLLRPDAADALRSVVTSRSLKLRNSPLCARRSRASEIDNRIVEIRTALDVQPDCSEEELARAAKTSVALDRMVEIHRLGSLAYYYQGRATPDNEDAISSIILGTSLLTARGIPVAGEYEIKNAQAMKIMDSFGAGGSFTEYLCGRLRR